MDYACERVSFMSEIRDLDAVAVAVAVAVVNSTPRRAAKLNAKADN